MGAIQSKGHITIDGYLFMLARQPRVDRHIYGREEAPTFVNKFSSGDPNYRDASFFPHFVQNNWLNGFDQEQFNDGGKFYRSSGVDITSQEKLTLQKRFTLAGLATSGIKINTQESWRSLGTSYFGNGSDGNLTISANTTDAPIDSACTGSQGSTSLAATNASFASGQYILIHQSQGAGAGNWQRTKILGYVAGTITTEDPLTYNYVAGAQVLVLKQYANVTVNSGVTWTAKAWNGSTGGILAFLCNGTLTVTGSINATGKGYRGSTWVGQNTGGAGYAGEGYTVSYNTTRTTAANTSGGGGGENEQSSNGRIAGGGGGGNGTAGSAGGARNGSGAVVGSGGSTSGNAALTSLVFGGGGGAPGVNWQEALTTRYGGNGGGAIYILGKTISITGSVVSNGANGDTYASANSGAAGGGAGGSILIKAQTATLGSSLITASGGVGGTAVMASANGGNGGVGRIHIDYLTSFTGTTSPTIDSAVDSTLSDTPSTSGFQHFVGGSDGRIYQWDGASTYTEVFNARNLAWYISGDDADANVGSTADNRQAQSFQLSANATTVRGVRLKMRRNTAVGDYKVTIQTNSGSVPSGTLANASATIIVPNASIPTTNDWVNFEFPSSFNLSASTTYWIVLESTNAASETGVVVWRVDTSSPTYSSGNAASKVGAGAWSAIAGQDMLFSVLGNTTSINASIVTTVGGTTKMLFGVGSLESTTAGDARIIAYDGTNFSLFKIFNATNETAVLSFAEYGSTTTKLYIGLGSKAKVYVTDNLSTYTVSKTITSPNNPGYVFTMKEYNSRLYVAGGFPEQLYNNNYQYGGFLYSYDEFNWTKVSEFEHTVIKCMEVFDNLLFLGTLKKRLYVYNTASVDKLLEFPWDVQITAMDKWDDKLVLALAPSLGSAASGNEGIYLFDRNGFHNAFNVTGRSWYSLDVFNNNLMGGNDNGQVYQTSFTTYQDSGTMQLSYFEAALPNIDKKWRSLVVHHEALPAGTSILCEYKTDESDSSWTSIGTANVVGSLSSEFSFASAFVSRKISLRFTLTTTNPAVTPTLKIADMRYVLVPDFKYLWKMKLVCADNLVWLDGTEPIATTTAAITNGQTTLTLSDASGFPTKHKAVIVDNGVENEFSWTGKSGNQLTGVVGLTTHAGTGLTVKMTGRVMHKLLLTLKQTKTLYTYTDIDELTYTILFHNYQSDDFVVNQTDGIENNVPITLLEA